MIHKSGRDIGIEELASKVRSDFNIPCPIVDIKTIIKENLGGFYSEEDLEDLLNGKIEQINDSFCITIDQKTENKIFAYAKALGHLFLHLGFHYDAKKWKELTEYKASAKYRLGFSVDNFEASAFSLALLMPRNDFLFFIKGNYNKDTNTLDLQKVADYFNVPIKDVRTRGKALGVFI